jgi:hypothetical protein
MEHALEGLASQSRAKDEFLGCYSMPMFNPVGVAHSIPVAVHHLRQHDRA